MNRVIATVLLLVLLLNVGCESTRKTISGVEYQDYGIFNQDSRDAHIQYEPDWWNICIGAIFFEMIIPPIYVFGFHMMAPVTAKRAAQPVAKESI